MTVSRPLFCFAAISAFLLPDVFALDWATTTIDAKPKPGEAVVLATYNFVNASKAKVEIGGITTDCGCTNTMVSSSDIAPGQSGYIQVTFTIGRRTGKQHKEILVETSDAKEPVKLILNVDLPEAAKATPKE